MPKIECMQHLGVEHARVFHEADQLLRKHGVRKLVRFDDVGAGYPRYRWGPYVPVILGKRYDDLMSHTVFLPDEVNALGEKGSYTDAFTVDEVMEIIRIADEGFERLVPEVRDAATHFMKTRCGSPPSDEMLDKLVHELRYGSAIGYLATFVHENCGGLSEAEKKLMNVDGDTLYRWGEHVHEVPEVLYAWANRTHWVFEDH